MKNEKLTELYLRWYAELYNCAPKLLSEAYSNPHYVAVPKDWDRARAKIMIVGEEGYGKSGCGRLVGWTMHEIREWTLSYLNVQLSGNKEHTDYNRSPFWNRIRRIKSKNTSFVWNNIDKIYNRIPTGRNHALSISDRKRLHSTRTKVLREEIEIIFPDIVVFFGWHNHSLEAELPELYNRLYGNGRQAVEKGVYTIECDERIYIFTWHPFYQPLKYEDEVVAEIKRAIMAKQQ